MLAHRQLKWSAFFNKKVIMIERISFHGKVGKHLGRLALICTAQQQFVAIEYINIPPSLQYRVLDFVIDPKFPDRGSSIKHLTRDYMSTWLMELDRKIIRGQHTARTASSESSG